MIYIVLNGGAILAATAAGLALGLIWRVLLARGLMGGQAGGPGAASTLLLAFVAEAWLCAILAGALILAPPKGGVWTMTIGSAFVIWLGFVVPALAASYRMRALPACRATIKMRTQRQSR